MKTVKEERLAIILELTRSGSDVNVSCRADYEVTSDDLTVNRSLELDLTPTQETTIKGFGAQVLTKIKQKEA